jgi:hypothetical protein
MADDQSFIVPSVATPEAVALALVQAVMRVEGKRFGKGYDDSPDRKYILDTYAECLVAVRNPESRAPSEPLVIETRNAT